MKWFKKHSKPKPNEHVGLLFETDGIPIEESEVQFFPKLDQVLVKPNHLHKASLFPLCSVHLKEIESDWDFWAHFIAVYRTLEEPHATQKYHSHHCTAYSLGFDWVDGKYDLQAHPKVLEVAEFAEKYQKKAKEKYQRFAKDFQVNGLENLPNKNFNYFIKQFGKKPLWVQEDATPKDISGNAMQFIGQVRVMDFIGGAQHLYLFYSAEHHYFVQCEQYQ